MMFWKEGASRTETRFSEFGCKDTKKNEPTKPFAHFFSIVVHFFNFLNSLTSLITVLAVPRRNDTHLDTWYPT